MDDKNFFTEEELKANIRVPKTVEDKLRMIVERCLERSGIYHQVFSRIKTVSSLALKYRRKNYNENKKIQDLVGVRVDVYFEDDLKICRKLLERLFGETEWSMTDYDNEEFKPQKMNGVFRLPADLKAMISDETWDYYIDDTFEIQLKTIFFEGWHEIEHDMKYKGSDLWEGKSDRSRYFNTILATLELCDKSIVTLFENLGHDLYHEKNWAGMIKAHFRLKMIEGDLYPELQEFFDNDHRVDNVPKRIFKTKREDLIYALLELPRRIQIDINVIVAVINKNVIQDPDVEKILEDRDVFGKRSVRQVDEEVRYDLRIPEFMSTFHAGVTLKTNEENRDEQFASAVKTIYSWMYNKFSGVLLNLKEEPGDNDIEELGFRLKTDLRYDEKIFMCTSKHIDIETPGRIWITYAIIVPGEDGELHFTVDNGFTYFPDENDKSDVTRQFSCPRFYRQVANQIGVVDVWELGSTFCVTEKEQADKLYDLITSDYRSFPLVMLISENLKDGRLDESWLGGFAIRYIQEKAGHYAHFARMHTPLAKYILDKLAENNIRHQFSYEEGMKQGLIVTLPKKEGILRTESFSEGHIANCSFASFDAIEHLQPFRVQDNGKAFGNELLQLLRRMNTDYDPYKIS